MYCSVEILPEFYMDLKHNYLSTKYQIVSQERRNNLNTDTLLMLLVHEHRLLQTSLIGMLRICKEHCEENLEIKIFRKQFSTRPLEYIKRFCNHNRKCNSTLLQDLSWKPDSLHLDVMGKPLLSIR